MLPLSEDDLILYLYGESADAAAIEARAEGDPQLRARLDSLRDLLDTVSSAPPTEPPADLEDRLWQGLAPALAPAPQPLSWAARARRTLRRQRPVLRRAAAMAAVLVLVVTAYLLGRLDGGPDGEAEVTVASDRILLVAVGEHFSRSQMLFLELANADLEQQLDTLGTGYVTAAAPLLTDNRLYRQTAMNAGQQQLVAVLDALERVLTELANPPPGSSSAAHLEALRQRIEDLDLLFKLRVLDNTIERLIQAPPTPHAAPAGAHI